MVSVTLPSPHHLFNETKSGQPMLLADTLSKITVINSSKPPGDANYPWREGTSHSYIWMKQIQIKYKNYFAMALFSMIFFYLCYHSCTTEAFIILRASQRAKGSFEKELLNLLIVLSVCIRLIHVVSMGEGMKGGLRLELLTRRGNCGLWESIWFFQIRGISAKRLPLLSRVFYVEKQLSGSVVCIL